jgi:hypothetical protein
MTHAARSSAAAAQCGEDAEASLTFRHLRNPFWIARRLGLVEELQIRLIAKDARASLPSRFTQQTKRLESTD